MLIYIIVSGMHGHTNIKVAFFGVVDEQFNSIKMHGINNVKLSAVFGVSAEINTHSETRMVCELSKLLTLSIRCIHLADFQYNVGAEGESYSN